MSDMKELEIIGSIFNNNELESIIETPVIEDNQVETQPVKPTKKVEYIYNYSSIPLCIPPYSSIFWYFYRLCWILPGAQKL